MEGDHADGYGAGCDARISIHALRVEGDAKTAAQTAATNAISIHALRVEGDQSDFECRRRLGISIHALRVEGDGRQFWAMNSKTYDFYPRPPGGGRQAFRRFAALFFRISIHALRVEGDAIHPILGIV